MMSESRGVCGPRHGGTSSRLSHSKHSSKGTWPGNEAKRTHGMGCDLKWDWTCKLSLQSFIQRVGRTVSPTHTHTHRIDTCSNLQLQVLNAVILNG